MLLLASADTHGVMSIYEWLVASASKHSADAVLLAGDLFAGDLAAGQRAQSPKIVAALKRCAAPVYYIMGNDDNCALGYEDDQVRPLGGRRLECGGYNFVGYEYSPPFVGGPYEKPEPEMARDLEALAALVDARTVLVTHAPAQGILDRTYGGERVGSRAIAGLIERHPPLAHVHGHIHESFGRDGNHFNAAAAGRPRAFLIELEGENLGCRILDSGTTKRE